MGRFLAFSVEFCITAILFLKIVTFSNTSNLYQGGANALLFHTLNATLHLNHVFKQLMIYHTGSDKATKTLDCFLNKEVGRKILSVR